MSKSNWQTEEEREGYYDQFDYDGNEGAIDELTEKCCRLLDSLLSCLSGFHVDSDCACSACLEYDSGKMPNCKSCSIYHNLSVADKMLIANIEAIGNEIIKLKNLRAARRFHSEVCNVLLDCEQFLSDQITEPFGECETCQE